jgi:hypothetical protein
VSNEAKITPIEPGNVPHELVSAVMESLPRPSAVMQLDGIEFVIVMWRDRWRCTCLVERDGDMEESMKEAVVHLASHRRPWWRRLLRRRLGSEQETA